MDAVTQTMDNTVEMNAAQLAAEKPKTYAELKKEAFDARRNERVTSAVALQEARGAKQTQASEAFRNGLSSLVQKVESGYVKATGAPEAIKGGLLNLQDKADQKVVDIKLKVNEVNENSAKRVDAVLGGLLGRVQAGMDNLRARHAESKAIKPDLMVRISQKKQEVLQGLIDALQKTMTAEKATEASHAETADKAKASAAELRAGATINRENSTWFGSFRARLSARLS